MVHEPCGSINFNSPCMQVDHCSKKYPKQYMAETQLGANSYPLYRRSSPENGGHVSTISMRIGGSQVDQQVDNRWIFPYNILHPLCTYFSTYLMDFYGYVQFYIAVTIDGSSIDGSIVKLLLRSINCHCNVKLYMSI